MRPKPQTATANTVLVRYFFIRGPYCQHFTCRWTYDKDCSNTLHCLIQTCQGTKFGESVDGSETICRQRNNGPIESLNAKLVKHNPKGINRNIPPLLRRIKSPALDKNTPRIAHPRKS